MIRRHAESRIAAALDDTPVVLVHGPRQSGKSTLTLKLARERGLAYVTLDDLAARELAESNPEAFLKTYPAPRCIDEVQRCPGIMLALKAEIDRDRKPGMALLTGSANVLSLPKAADSLAGRMEIVDLQPLIQSEIEGRDDMRFVDYLLDGFKGSASSQDWAERALRGGFPEPFQRGTPARRDAWFQSYVRAMLDRDVRDLAQIQGLTQMPRLLRTIAARIGETLNITAFSRETGLPATTLERYLDLLRAIFMVRTLPPWTSDPRLIKSPKVYLADSGLLTHLSGADERRVTSDPRFAQALLANFVFNQLEGVRAATGWSLHHLRTTRGREVDFLFETPAGDIYGFTPITEAAATPAHAEGLRWLREIAGPRFRRGIVLHSGDRAHPLDERIEAWPLASLWS